MTWTLADAANLAARNEFASTVTYTPAAGGSYSIAALLGRPFEGIQLGGADVMIAGRKPVLDVRLADLPVTPIAGDELTVESADYVVEEVEPDGQGGVKLILSNGV